MHRNPQREKRQPAKTNKQKKVADLSLQDRSGLRWGAARPGHGYTPCPGIQSPGVRCSHFFHRKIEPTRARPKQTFSFGENSITSVQRAESDRSSACAPARSAASLRDVTSGLCSLLTLPSGNYFREPEHPLQGSAFPKRRGQNDNNRHPATSSDTLESAWFYLVDFGGSVCFSLATFLKAKRILKSAPSSVSGGLRSRENNPEAAAFPGGAVLGSRLSWLERNVSCGVPLPRPSSTGPRVTPFPGPSLGSGSGPGPNTPRTATMSSDFEGYEQDFAVLTAEITSKITRVPRLPPGERPAHPRGMQGPGLWGGGKVRGGGTWRTPESLGGSGSEEGGGGHPRDVLDWDWGAKAASGWLQRGPREPSGPDLGLLRRSHLQSFWGRESFLAAVRGVGVVGQGETTSSKRMNELTSSLNSQ